MAKAAIKTGMVDVHSTKDITDPESIAGIQLRLYEFIDRFRLQSKKLSSFILTIHDEELMNFDRFETEFFNFLQGLRELDRKLYLHDPRVSSDPGDSNFSYSIKSEAFFIVALHPESPRLARRFKRPAIVFNPHIQFDNLRRKNVFQKIKNVIRSKDKKLQGTINPMLNDFGVRSEVFQYMGRIYAPDETIPLLS